MSTADNMYASLRGIVIVAVGLALGGCPGGESGQPTDEQTVPYLGPNETPGEPGLQGPMGAAGLEGRMGLPGATGAPGPRGDRGANGIGSLIVANAGGAATASPCEIVVLSAAGTMVQPHAGIPHTELAYRWTQVDRSGVVVELVNAHEREAAFAVPAASPMPEYVLEFRLTVTAPNGEIAEDDTLVLVRGPVPHGATFVTGAADLTVAGGEIDIGVQIFDGNGEQLEIECAFCAANFEFRNVEVTPEGQQPATLPPFGASSIEPAVFIKNHSINAVLDFDSSGSMQTNDPNAVGRRAGANEFFSCIDPNGLVAVLDFGAGVDGGPCAMHSRVLQDFTNDVHLLRAALDELTAHGTTPLWGSALDALCLLADRFGGGGAAVLLTDGFAADPGLLDTVIATAVAQDSEIYTIGLGERVDAARLRLVATSTGGAFAHVSDPNALAGVFADVCTGIRETPYINVRGVLSFERPGCGPCTIAGELVVRSAGRRLAVPFQIEAEVRQRAGCDWAGRPR